MHHPENCASLFLRPDRRSLLSGLAAAAVSPAVLRAQAPDAAPAEDERFMQMALDEARQANLPFGAVIVRDGAVIARGRNRGRTDRDPTAHGEMVAIRRCLAEHGPDALVGSTLYTSGEPCAMCMGAILWCRFGRLVYAASVAQLATRINQIMISSAELAARAPFLPDLDHRRRAGGRGAAAVPKVARGTSVPSRRAALYRASLKGAKSRSAGRAREQGPNQNPCLIFLPPTPENQADRRISVLSDPRPPRELVAPILMLQSVRRGGDSRKL